jgi:FKBP-type peptidyl-prolyl cis-trans isomerase SlyD
LTVVRLTERGAILDANHPLAGKTLHFEVEVIKVRAATEEEVEHGHVHEGELEHG